MSETAFLFTAKDHYLYVKPVADFCDYFAEYLAGRPFCPPYTTEVLKPKTSYCFLSLEDAWQQYLLEPANCLLEEKMQALREPARTALAQNDNEALFEIIDELASANSLLRRNSEAWLQANRAVLCKKITEGYVELTGDFPDIKRFGKEGFHMTVLISQVYALLSGNTVTYGSRVCASLGLFIREFCLSRSMALPEELRWGMRLGWGTNKHSSTRNPSWGETRAMRFPCTEKMKDTPKIRMTAQSNLYATWVVQHSIALACSKQTPGVQWLANEDAVFRVVGALYMMGARLPLYVPGSPTF